MGRGMSLSANGNRLAIGSPGGPFYSGSNEEGFVQVFNLDAVLSTSEFQLTEFDVFPNPANIEFNIQLKEGIRLEKANIYNQLGQLILSSSETNIDVNNLSQGMYFVEVITNQGNSTKKLIIE